MKKNTNKRKKNSHKNLKTNSIVHGGIQKELNAKLNFYYYFNKFVGASTKCFCGHRYKEHDFLNP